MKNLDWAQSYQYLISYEWKLIFIILEILAISIVLAFNLSSLFAFIASLILLTLFLYFESTSLPISISLSAWWVLILFAEAQSIFSSWGSMVIALCIFITALYVHIISIELIQASLEPIAKKVRLFIPLRNTNIVPNIKGESLDNWKVKRYVNDVMFYLMPFHNKRATINIKEVSSCRSSYAGTCIDIDEHTIQINIATHVNGIRQTKKNMMIILAHELVHAKQFLTGVLWEDYWHGEDFRNTAYRERPWEKEAYALQDKIFNKFWYFDIN